MNGEAINIENKIITYDDLLDIFARMQERLIHYKKINDMEELKNKMLEYRYQIWSFHDVGSKLTFDVRFTDGTSVHFDNYNNFIFVFNNRLSEIKYIYVYFVIQYASKEEGIKTERYNQSIGMFIYEDKMKINVSLDSKDDKISDIYELIKNKIANAPVKYDKVMKNKNKINTTVSFAVGLIPALIILSLLLYFPTVRLLYAKSYAIYPIAVLVLAYFIGEIFGASKLDKWYRSINPKQKYVGYDHDTHESIYKDDIDNYINSSEILIGKNADNLECRKNIMLCYEKYKKFLPYEIVALFIMSILVLFLE